MNVIAMTRATTSMGVILKLQLFAIELRDSPSGFGEAILPSSITDLSQLDRKR